jgi:hypothetical protein
VSLRLAYLVSRYPTVSHTFIEREVLGLRRLGTEVETFSVRRPEAREVLSDEARAEHARTTSLVPARPLRLLVAHLSALLRAPGAYAGTLRASLALANGGLRDRMWRVAYFGEAVLLWHLLHRRGLRHLHVHFANNAADVAMLTVAYGNAAGDGDWSWSFTMHGPTEFADVTRFRLAEKVRAAAFVVCISDYARSQLMALVEHDHWEKLHIVTCGVDLARFAAEAA